MLFIFWNFSTSQGLNLIFWRTPESRRYYQKKVYNSSYKQEKTSYSSSITKKSFYQATYLKNKSWNDPHEKWGIKVDEL